MNTKRLDGVNYFVPNTGRWFPEKKAQETVGSLLDRLMANSRILLSYEEDLRDRGITLQADAVHRHIVLNDRALNHARGLHRGEVESCPNCQEALP